METLESIIKMCRLCLENDGCISLFATDDNVLISDMLLACTSIKLLVGQSGPNQMCALCIIRLRDAFFFRTQCLKSDIIISNICQLGPKPDVLIKTPTIVNEPTTLHDAWVNFEDADFYEDDLPLTELKYTNEHRERTSNECRGRQSNELKGRQSNETRERTSNEFRERTSNEPRERTSIEVRGRISNELRDRMTRNELKERTCNETRERLNEFKDETAMPKYGHETNECKDGTKENSKKQKKVSKTLGGTKSKRKKEVSLEQLNKKIRKLEKLTQIKSDFVRLSNSESFDDGNFEAIENVDMDDKSLVKTEFFEGDTQILAEEQCIKKRHKTERKKLNDSVGLLIKQESLPIECENGLKGTARNIEQLFYESDVNEFLSPIKKVPRSRRKGQYYCDICGHCAPLKWNLIIHLRRHTGEKPFKCDTCPKRFAHEGSLRVHKKLHTGDKGFVCDVCGKGLSTKDTLHAHRRLHTGELPFTCPTCGRAFRALTNLRSHRRIHTGDKRHPCPVCAKLFYTKSDMRDHARRHTGERPYACELCPQRFTGKSNHRLHMKIHAGQRDFQCPSCPKTFVSKDSMQRHCRTHSGERAFECLECGRKFTHRSSLVSHRAIHSKTKDFVCDICSQRFGYPSGLYVHRKKKHNIQPSRIVTSAPCPDLVTPVI